MYNLIVLIVVTKNSGASRVVYVTNVYRALGYLITEVDCLLRTS